MPVDRFRATTDRQRIQMEGMRDPHRVRRVDTALRHEAREERKALVPRQSVEEFLADGGTIRQVETGLVGVRRLSAKGRQRLGRKTMTRFPNKK